MTATRRLAIILISIVVLAIVFPFALAYWAACLLVSVLAFAGRLWERAWVRIARAL